MAVAVETARVLEIRRDEGCSLFEAKDRAFRETTVTERMTIEGLELELMNDLVTGDTGLRSVHERSAVETMASEIATALHLLAAFRKMEALATSIGGQAQMTVTAEADGKKSEAWIQARSADGRTVRDGWAGTSEFTRHGTAALTLIAFDTMLDNVPGN